MADVQRGSGGSDVDEALPELRLHRRIEVDRHVAAKHGIERSADRPGPDQIEALEADQPARSAEATAQPLPSRSNQRRNAAGTPSSDAYRPARACSSTTGSMSVPRMRTSRSAASGIRSATIAASE